MAAEEAAWPVRVRTCRYTHTQQLYIHTVILAHKCIITHSTHTHSDPLSCMHIDSYIQLATPTRSDSTTPTNNNMYNVMPSWCISPSLNCIRSKHEQQARRAMHTVGRLYCHSMLTNRGEHSAASYFKDTLDTVMEVNRHAELIV